MTRPTKALLLSSVFVALAGLAIFTTAGSGAKAGEHWISVNTSELQHIQALRGSKDSTGLRSLPAEKIIGDVAILRLNEGQMEELSRSMHDNFHKCAGFVAHDSEREALEFVNNFAKADTDAPQITYTIDNGASVNPMLSLVSEPQTRQTIIDLSAFPNRRYNQPSGLQSATWIFNKWSTLVALLPRGYATVEYFNHPTATSPQPSVILTFPGRRFPDEIVVLGAHQDSINQSGSTASAPGADDDASGVACLTEIIRVMAETGFAPDRTVQFMAYAAEEVGLRGSNAIATSYRNANKNVIGSLQLDMTNYKGTMGYDIVIFTDFTNAAQNQFVTNLINTYQPGLNVTTSSCGYACSDHASWHNKAYPASMPFEAVMGNDNAAIHTANDTIARSNNNANHATRFTKLGVTFVGELAKGCVAPICQR